MITVRRSFTGEVDEKETRRPHLLAPHPMLRHESTSSTHSTASVQRHWIEQFFKKRECVKFIPSTSRASRPNGPTPGGGEGWTPPPSSGDRCGCGRFHRDHKYLDSRAVKNPPPSRHLQVPSAVAGFPGGVAKERDKKWSIKYHTSEFPTDAFGTIEFQGAPSPSRAQYIRLAHDTKSENVMALFKRHWNVELPKLVISVHGGIANFDLQPKLKRMFRKGLLKAAKTAGAWIITNGMSTGAVRHVGDALCQLSCKSRQKIVTIGVAAWGVVESKDSLVGQDVETHYHPVNNPKSANSCLNPTHTHFLLVDNGTEGKYGAEIFLRKNLEKHIARQMRLMTRGRRHGVPVVYVVLEGGTNTIQTVLECVTDQPPVPVVVCDGSGRAADLLAFTHKYAQDDGTMVESIRDQLLVTIMKTFGVGRDQAEKIFIELMLCTRKKHLITVFRIGDGSCQDIDLAILTALLKGPNLAPADQLSLALHWDRVDIARSLIFSGGQDWTEETLENAMMDALIMDRVDFVQLLIENGVTMSKFLSFSRLEELYNCRGGHPNTLKYLIKDVKKKSVTKVNRVTLNDIGMIVELLMGGAFRSHYCRRRIRSVYSQVTRCAAVAGDAHVPVVSFALPDILIKSPAEGSPTKDDDNIKENHIFRHPFHDLMVWACLLNRQKMALYMWKHGDEAMAKALIASKLFKSMSYEAAEDDLEDDICLELSLNSKEFQRLAVELLDHCYKQDDDLTQQLLLYELKEWSNQTCLSLAITANHKEFVAHPCVQILLTDMWMGGLRMRRNTSLKVMLGLLLPPYILALEFKSREELSLMPQTLEEHLVEQEDTDSSSNSSVSEGSSSSSSDSDSDSTESDNFSRFERDSVFKPKKQKTHRRSRQSPDKVLLKDLKTVNIKRDSVIRSQSQYSDNENDKSKILENGLNKTNATTVSNSFDHKFQSFSQLIKRKKKSSLKIGKKLYEFYTAPITKFWSYTISYLAMMSMYIYVVMVVTPEVYYIEFPEIYVITFMATMACEKLREVLMSDPPTLNLKFRLWINNIWNVMDCVGVVWFFVALSFRVTSEWRSVGRVLYAINISIWTIRSLKFFSVNKYLGPFVTLMGKMVIDMMYFCIIMLIVLMSFGIARQSIKVQNSAWDWHLIKEIFLMPYFMMYGEVYAGDIDPPCGDRSEHPDNPRPCITGEWVTPILMTLYLLVENILLVNLLIAIFNNTYNAVKSVSSQVWKFHRYHLIMEFERKPVIAPPFIVFNHIYILVKYCYRKVHKENLIMDTSLKLFLDQDSVEKLRDFEEDCMEDYFKEKEIMSHSSADEKLKLTVDRVEGMASKMEDVQTRENCVRLSLQTLELRMMKMEEVASQIVGSLQVIHRFMATQMSEPPDSEMDDETKWPSGRRDRNTSSGDSGGVGGHLVHASSGVGPLFGGFTRSNTLLGANDNAAEAEAIQASFIKGTDAESMQHFATSDEEKRKSPRTPTRTPRLPRLPRIQRQANTASGDADADAAFAALGVDRRISNNSDREESATSTTPRKPETEKLKPFTDYSFSKRREGSPKILINDEEGDIFEGSCLSPRASFDLDEATSAASFLPRHSRKRGAASLKYLRTISHDPTMQLRQRQRFLSGDSRSKSISDGDQETKAPVVSPFVLPDTKEQDEIEEQTDDPQTVRPPFSPPLTGPLSPFGPGTRIRAPEHAEAPLTVSSSGKGATRGRQIVQVGVNLSSFNKNEYTSITDQIDTACIVSEFDPDSNQMSALILDYSTDIQQFSTKATPQEKIKEEEANRLVEIEQHESLVMAKVLIKRAKRQNTITAEDSPPESYLEYLDSESVMESWGGTECPVENGVGGGESDAVDDEVVSDSRAERSRDGEDGRGTEGEMTMPVPEGGPGESGAESRPSPLNVDTVVLVPSESDSSAADQDESKL